MPKIINCGPFLQAAVDLRPLTIENSHGCAGEPQFPLKS